VKAERPPRRVAGRSAVQGPWCSADADTRFEILALINAAITTLRGWHGLPSFDDPLSDQEPTGFLVIRELLR
jgi:hypothetical protein